MRIVTISMIICLASSLHASEEKTSFIFEQHREKATKTAVMVAKRKSSGRVALELRTPANPASQPTGFYYIGNNKLELLPPKTNQLLITANAAIAIQAPEKQQATCCTIL
jgi:hypothetical protein